MVTKPRPADIDEWTHCLHDPSNNAVAHNQRIAPPASLQWQSGPRWSRHRDHMASVSAMVTAGGRSSNWPSRRPPWRATGAAC